MNKYIDRTLRIDGKNLPQTVLLEPAKNIIVVLAEPGAGKSTLVENLAEELGAKRIRASQFRYKTKVDSSETLIIDGLDEVSKIDKSAIDEIIVKASELEPRKVIFASRSAQWEEANSKFVEGAFGSALCVAYLHPLDDTEQRMLFESYKPEQDFGVFKTSLEKLDVGQLLGNPQMLKIFADAFVQSKGKFSTKRQVFRDAIKQLAREKNIEIPQAKKTPVEQIIKQSEEVFCKTLLSGSAGVSTTEIKADQEFPYIETLISSKGEEPVATTETGLFKPSDKTDQHEPVHRVVAEYSAARYLVRRIQDPRDRLSLRRSLSLIAPNGVPRDELRGLLAWMATEGDASIQESVIRLDPYAIISNGDPSFLEVKSKTMLLNRLKVVADENPYFRGADVWRNFSAAGFFTADIVNETRKIISDRSTNEQLRSLLLELLVETPAAASLTKELTALLLDKSVDEYTRVAVFMILKDLKDFDHLTAFTSLLNEKSTASLKCASNLVEYFGVPNVGLKNVSDLLSGIAQTYYDSTASSGRAARRTIGSRYFITRMIGSFDTSTTIHLLDTLTLNLSCTCKAKRKHACCCRRGVSGLVARLLDRLFELGNLTPTTDQIIGWTKALKFEHPISSKDSKAVSELQRNDQFRQNVHRKMFGTIKDADKIFDLKSEIYINNCHSGLSFKYCDFQAITDYAFQTDNVTLWSCFIEPHRMYAKENFENPYRSHMRRQALEKPEFGRAWALRNRAWKIAIKKNKIRSFGRSSAMRRRRQRDEKIKYDNQQHFDDNFIQISAGQHLGWLYTFAKGYLKDNVEHLPQMPKSSIPVEALIKSIGFLEQKIPRLSEIGANSLILNVVYIANAACLAHFRKYGNLNGVARKTLIAIKMEALRETCNDSDEYNAEINRYIFKTATDLEQFARELIEAQLKIPKCQFSNVSLLSYNEEFHSLREDLPIEWMENFPNMHLSSLKTLFDIAAEYGDQPRLKVLIQNQIANLGNPPEDQDELEAFNTVRNFWFLRKFFFFTECDEKTIFWLNEDRERLLLIYHIAGRGNQEEHLGWGSLGGLKVKLILEIFIDKWPKVHLPSSWGSGDPPEQTAYRFLRDVAWRVKNEDLATAIAAIDQLLLDKRFVDFEPTFKAQKADIIKKRALQSFLPPSPKSLVEMLDNQQVASVEDMRALLIEQLTEMQAWLKGAETNPKTYFYNEISKGNYERKDENNSTKVIADRLQLSFESLGLAITIEHYLHDGKRSDLTLQTIIDGRQYLLVTEVKGQWNRELFTAAAEQLETRYMNHPNAADQGVYLILWFGEKEKVAGVKGQGITSGAMLRAKIIENMPSSLASRIDVFVLDVSI